MEPTGRQWTAEDLVDRLLQLGSGELLVVTGAGISRASGIDTFRGSDPGAVWKTSDVALATRACLERDPVAQWRWYLQRFSAAGEARPNPAHLALVELAALLDSRGGTLHLVTQNIDTLHEQAGSTDLLKVHGSADRVRCSGTGCEFGAPAGSLPFDASRFDAFKKSPSVDNLPRCPSCGALLRAHVLFFDEYYLEHRDYRYADAERLAMTADLMLFVGTSFSVGITDLYLRAGNSRGIDMWSIDPVADSSSLAIRPLVEAAEDALPECCQRLRRRIEGEGKPD